MPVGPPPNTAISSPDRTRGVQNGNSGPDIPSRERTRRQQDQNNSRQARHISGDKHANFLSDKHPPSSTKGPGDVKLPSGCDSGTSSKMQQQQQQQKRGAPREFQGPRSIPSPRNDSSKRDRDRALPDRDRMHDRSPRDRDRDPGNLGPANRPHPDRSDSRNRNRDGRNGSNDGLKPQHDLRSDRDRNISSPNNAHISTAGGSSRSDERGSSVGRRPTAAAAAAAPAREQQRRQRSRSPPLRPQQQQQRLWSSEPGQRRDLDPPSRQRQQQQQQPGHRPASSPRGRSAAAAAALSPRSQQRQQQPPAALVVPSGAPAAAAAAAPATPGSNAFEMLERFLGRQAALQEVLVPTAGNISTVFITRDDFLEFLSWQEWVNGYLGMKLQLLSGTYVAVPATGMEPSSSREAVEAEQAVPFRIRQVKAVEINFATDVRPEQARVLLVGGGAVEASQLGEQMLVQIPDHEALCCELASLQLQMYAPVLRLYDIAHTVWRLRLCSALEEIIKRWKQDAAELEAGGHDVDFIASAEQQAFEEIRLRIRQLPKASYMSEVVEYVDFRTTDQTVLQQQLEDATARWQQYVQHQRQRLHQQQPGQLVLPPGLAPQQQQQPPPGQLLLPPGLAQQQQQQPAPGQWVLPPGLAPQQALLPQQQQPGVTVVYLPPPQQQQATQLQVGSAYLHPPAAAAAADGGGAAGTLYNSSSSGLNLSTPFNPDPAGPVAQGFVEVDDPEFYDDPTGLGGLSPLPENPNSQAPQTLAQTPGHTQPYGSGSLGFGMGSSGGVTTHNRIQDPSTRDLGSRDVGFGSSMAPQQQQWDGRAPALQPFLSKYENDRGNPPSSNHSSGGAAAAAAAAADLAPQQQQQQSSYAYWVEQGDIAAAETDPRMRRAQAHIAAMNAAHAPPAAAAAAGYELPMGRLPPVGPDPYLQRQQQQSLLRGHDSVFERLGPVNPGDTGVDHAAAARFISAAKEYVAAAAADDSKHHGNSKDRESRKQDRRDSDKVPIVRDRDRDARSAAAAAAAARPRSRSREKKSSKDKSKRQSSLDRTRDSRSKESKSGRDKDRAAAAAAGSSKDDRRDKAAAAAAAAASKEPSPDLKDVLHRLVVGAKQLPDGPPASRITDRSPYQSRDRREFERTDRSKPRTRSISRDRSRPAVAAGSRGRSHSPGWRSEKRIRTSDDHRDHAAAAAGSGGSRSPGHIDAVRRRFTGRLEGVDGIFNSLQQELQQQAFQAPGLPRSPDQIIKGWLHRLASMKQEGRDRGDGFFHLQYLRAHLPVPNEAIEAWGTVYNFLHNHPAIIFSAASKMVTVDDSVDINAVSAFPRDRGTAGPPEEPRWGSDDHHAGFRPPSRQDGPGPGPSPGFNPHLRAGQGLGPLRVPDPPGPEVRVMTPAGNGYNTNYSPGSAAAAIAVAELQQDTDAFSEELQRALSAAPQGYIHVAQGYRLLPPRLAAKVQRGQPVDLVKFVQDNMSDVEIVHKPGVDGLVIQRVPPGRVWQRPRLCAYWDPDRWSSCKKGSTCDFKHDLLSTTS